jgi:type IV secretion system protein VirB8
MTEERATYYPRASTWALDEQAAAAGALRRARVVAAAAGVIAVLEALALLLLVPLKTTTMVPVLVDRQTGFVEVLKSGGQQELQPNESLTQSLLVQYVVARESFNLTTLQAEHRKVALWSAGAARNDYLALMPAANPNSPMRIYPRTTLVETEVKSVSPLGRHTALVRFDTRRRDQGAPPSAGQAWAAVVTYRFSNEALSAADRWQNPLGFQVVSYHRDAEALPAPELQARTVVAAPPAPSGGAAAPPAAGAAGRAGPP